MKTCYFTTHAKSVRFAPFKSPLTSRLILAHVEFRAGLKNGADRKLAPVVDRSRVAQSIRRLRATREHQVSPAVFIYWLGCAAGLQIAKRVATL